MVDDTRKPIETPFDKTVPDLEQEPHSDGSGEERLREDIGETEGEETKE